MRASAISRGGGPAEQPAMESTRATESSFTVRISTTSRIPGLLAQPPGLCLELVRLLAKRGGIALHPLGVRLRLRRLGVLQGLHVAPARDLAVATRRSEPRFVPRAAGLAQEVGGELPRAGGLGPADRRLGLGDHGRRDRRTARRAIDRERGRQQDDDGIPHGKPPLRRAGETPPTLLHSRSTAFTVPRREAAPSGVLG